MTRTRTAATAAAILAAAAVPLLGAAPASAAATVQPWDFNGDGHADLAVGAPGEDIGSGADRKSDAGAVSVFLADPSTGRYGAGTVFYQGKGEVPNAAESGDQFGYAMTSGDFDGDGYADLAVAANREKLAGKRDAGLVIVLWGSSTGLTDSGAKGLAFNGSATYPGAFVGDGLASGDMDADGKDELAVGSPGTERVGIFRGDDKTAFGSGGATIRFGEDTAQVPGTRHVGSAAKAGDLFGEALAMGDFDHDGRADLVVGAPYDYDVKGYAVGAITVFPGASGLTDFADSTRWTPFTKGIIGTGHTFTVNDQPDSFGRTLATGDFNGDGYEDVAVGIPGSPVSRNKKKYEDAGAVSVLFGSSSGISSADRHLTQESAGVLGASTRRDMFGASLDATSRTSGKDLLAVGSAEELVRVLPAAAGAGSVALSQNTAGVWGGAEKGDAFGAFVRFLDNVGNPAQATLAVAAPGENSGQGVVQVFPAQGGGIPTGAGDTRRVESDAGGTAEAGDSWGWLGDSH